jgi:hypothetical protein
MFRPFATVRLPAFAGLVEGRSFALTVIALMLAVVTPIVSTAMPPLTDFINHVARMGIMADLPTNPALARFYDVHWAVIPNLIMDVLVPPLARQIDLIVASRLFLLLVVVLLVTGPMAIHRALWGRLSPWPLLAFPLVYNGIFLYGLVNYLLGLGFALWGVAVWIALRERSVWRRAMASTACVLLLFLCHLFAVGLYGLTLLAFEIWRISHRPPRRLAAELLAFGLPFLPVIPLILASPTLGLSHVNVWESQGKLEGLYLAVQLYRDSVDMVFAAILIGAAVWLTRRDLLRLHGAGWVLLLLGSVVFLAMPRQLFGSWIADQRLPVALMFLLIGFFAPDLRGRLSRGAFYAFVMGLTLARGVEVQANWLDLSDITRDMRLAVGSIARGSTVLVARADEPAGGMVMEQALSHAPAWAVIERDALVSTIFAVPGKQILAIRPAFADLVDRDDGDPPSVSQLLASADGAIPGSPRFWDHWPGRYDYVFIIYTRPGAANPDPDRLVPVSEGRGFQLYRTRPDTE